ncbi:MAG TPA: cytochrome c oxidase subunit 3 [Chloroflexota bacterium]
MAAITIQHPTPKTQHPTIGPRKLGILLFIGSESMLFLSVIALYVTGQGHQGHPTAQESLNAARIIPFSVALWLSSGTIALCPGRVARGDQRGMRLWLGATVILGAIFLAGELAEWLSLFGQQITAASNMWATTFFTLTGIHGLHVIVGLLMMSALIGASTRVPIPHSGESSLEIVSLYWHFVDGMWVLIYGTVYVWSAFFGG